MFNLLTERRLPTAPQKAVVALLLLLAGGYLLRFVDRGWIPLDEGMIGETAEWVLTGALPHTDYEEPYPGALSYFYALIFKVAGIDLVNLRWTVFAGALVSLALVYMILRRFLSAVPAALGTWVALGWSFPNYFSSLPSWWVLLCALACLWGVIRYIETDRLKYVILAGLAAGVAITIKQTGVYLLPPLVMSLFMGAGEPAPPATIARQWGIVARGALALAGLAFVALVMRRGIGSGEVVYLLAPIACCGVAFVMSDRFTGASVRMDWRAPLVAVGSAAVPIGVLLLPHIAAGQVGAFLHGVLVLPQKRFEFNSMPMRPASQMIAAAIAVMWVLWSPRSLSPRELRILGIARWAVGVALALAALRVHLIYTFIWEAVRGTAALVPLLALWFIVSNRVQDSQTRRVLFASATMLAWASLSQFPFAAPIYFCYVAPLALIAGTAAVQAGDRGHRLGDGPAFAVALLFALLCLNRGYVWNMGWFHKVQDLTTALGLSRATLDVDRDEARIYTRVVGLIEQHVGERGVVAGPDTPELYFLSGRRNPSGQLFEFFSQSRRGSDAADELARWTAADVVVMSHRKRFSPALSKDLVSSVRREFPQGESVPPFEVRWR